MGVHLHLDIERTSVAVLRFDIEDAQLVVVGVLVVDGIDDSDIRHGEAEDGFEQELQQIDVRLAAEHFLESVVHFRIDAGFMGTPCAQGEVSVGSSFILLADSYIEQHIREVCVPIDEP